MTEFAKPVADRRAELEKRMASVRSQLESIRADRSSATADDEHDPEGSTLSAEWSRAEGQRADMSRELAELDAALERIADGTYGVCISCGSPIPRERLRVLPAALRCVPCESTR